MAVNMPKGEAAAPVKDREGVYNTAEVMPQFPGGQGALEDYVNNSVDYPQQAVDQNTSGTIRVSFIIDENGKVMNAHLLGGQRLGNGLDEEAVRVVDRMPAWKPGKVHGKNVKTRLELPINFQVEA
jgi:TonB family protein